MAEKFRPSHGGTGIESLKNAVEKRLQAHELSRQTRAAREPRETADIGGRQVEAWFLGPRAENADLFEQFVVEALRDHAFWRRNFHPSDPPAITQSVKRDPGYLAALDTMHTELDTLLAELKKSAPFFSMRYQGHMTWEQTLPGMTGYFAAMLYNQNNVALEASPLTTVLEVRVCEDLCRMLGYPEQGPILPWAHLTCGGTTANIEAMWAARNLKFYPLALQAAIAAQPELAPLQALEVPLVSGGRARLTDLDAWQALNLGVDEVLGLPARVEQEYGASHGITVARLTQLVSDYTLQDLGLVEFTRRHLDGLPAPVFLVPGSKHYSLPKAASILGIGADHMYSVPLDAAGRLDAAVLEQRLDQCLAERRPVIAAVAILGTTEEGLVDPLARVVALRRDKYRPAGMEFCVHADAAWGGYFASLLRAPAVAPRAAGPVPALLLSTYVTEQYQSLPEADTITLDPHKTGYLPYPAGALCYRNGAMRSLVAFEAPYINTAGGQEALTVGKYGIEGSKPGAAAAGVYLSHAVIPPDQSGYGQIHGRALYNCKMFHVGLLHMNAQSQEDFVVVPGPRLALPRRVLARFGGSEQSAMDRLGQIWREKTSAGMFVTADEDLELLREVGADLNILTYAFNFKTGSGLNTSLNLANEFNRQIYDRLGIKADGRDIYGYRLLVSTTDFVEADYGKVFFADYLERLLGVPHPSDAEPEAKISVLRSVIMDPWIGEDLQGRPFIETIMEEMHRTVHEVLTEMRAAGKLPG